MQLLESTSRLSPKKCRRQSIEISKKCNKTQIFKTSYPSKGLLEINSKTSARTSSEGSFGESTPVQYLKTRDPAQDLTTQAFGPMQHTCSHGNALQLHQVDFPHTQRKAK